MLICDICGRFPLQLEINSPTDFTDFHRFLYPRIRVHPRYLWKTSPHPISVLICDICGRFPLLLEIYSPTDSTDFHRFCIFQYPCSSVLSVGNTFAPNICVHLCYLWEISSATWDLFSHGFHRFSQILYIPESVFICAICGKHLRTQYPCSFVLSVGDSFAPWHMLEIASAAWDLFSHGFHRFHRFYISYVLSVRDSFLRCICGNLTKSIAIDFSNDTIINVICIEIKRIPTCFWARRR